MNFFVIIKSDVQPPILSLNMHVKHGFKKLLMNGTTSTKRPLNSKEMIFSKCTNVFRIHPLSLT